MLTSHRRTTCGWLTALTVIGLVSCESPVRPSTAGDPPHLTLPPRPAGIGDQVSTAFGTVYEHTTAAVQPLPGTVLRVWGYRPEYNLVSLEVSTDSAGSYTVPGLQREYLQVSVKPHDDFVSPCSVRTWQWTDQPWDVHVVSKTTLRAGGLPASMSISNFARLYPGTAVLVISGTVTESAPTASRPVGEAIVEHLYVDSEDPTGYTETTADGRFALCAYWDDYGQSIRVRKRGYRTAIEEIKASQIMNFELARE